MGYLQSPYGLLPLAHTRPQCPPEEKKDEKKDEIENTTKKPAKIIDAKAARIIDIR